MVSTRTEPLHMVGLCALPFAELQLLAPLKEVEHSIPPAICLRHSATLPRYKHNLAGTLLSERAPVSSGGGAQCT
jgi:hypothetical protein